MKTDNKFTTNKLHGIAEMYVQALTEDDQIIKNDVTQELYDTIDFIHIKKELLNGEINGYPATGKSTVNFALCDYALRRHFKTVMSDKFISVDQEAFLKWCKDEPNATNTYRSIDEWSELETTGLNSTITQALLNQKSDVHAQKFIHKWSCSPKDRSDKNSYILLQTVSANKKSKKTRCKVFYKVLHGGSEITQLCGFADIDVSKVVNKDWYEVYRKKKFKKMDLLNEHWITKRQELDNAKLFLLLIEKLKPLTALNTNVLDRGFVENYIKKYVRQLKMEQSMLGLDNLVKRTLGYLNPYIQQHKIQTQIKKLKITKKKTEDETFKRNIEEQIELQAQALEVITEAQEFDVLELEKHTELAVEYDGI